MFAIHFYYKNCCVCVLSLKCFILLNSSYKTTGIQTKINDTRTGDFFFLFTSIPTNTSAVVFISLCESNINNGKNNSCAYFITH